MLDRLRERTGRGPLWIDLDAVLSETLLAPEALLHFDGRRRFANLRKLVDRVRGWEGGGSASLPELVEILEEYSAPEVRESEAAVESAGDDSVRLMTIHAAKGLEFPLVVLADLGRGEPPGAHEEIFRRGLGLGIPLLDPEGGNRGLHPTSYRELRVWRDRAEEQEKNRLQYVAVTRAQEHLILSGWRREGKAPGGSWLAAILEGLGGEEALRSDPMILRPAAATTAAAGTPSSILSVHPGSIRELRPLPATPSAPDAASAAGELLRRVELPSPPHDATPYLVTATEIVQHHLCPRRYHLRYRIGAPALEYSRGSFAGEEGESGDVKDDELPAEVLGDRIHRVLAEAPGSRVIEEILGTLPPDEREAARRQVDTFEESRLGKEAAAGGAMREFPFAMSRHGAALRGQIDLILEGADGDLKVVDYKTSRIEAAEVEGRAADYELQLRIYALAVRDIFGRAPRAACLHFLHPDVVREVDISSATLEQAEQAIASYFDAHRLGVFPQNVAEHCRSCGYQKSYCPGVLSRIGPGPVR
jgi:ATP-dependent helicase/nuclease subunit A